MRHKKNILAGIAAICFLLFLFLGQPALLKAYPNGFFYRSEMSLAGIPLIDIRMPSQSRCNEINALPLPEIADAVIARGWLAMGMVSVGLISIGVLAIGPISCGVCSIGIVSFGVLSIAAWRSFGVLAVSWTKSIGVTTLDRTGFQWQSQLVKSTNKEIEQGGPAPDGTGQ